MLWMLQHFLRAYSSLRIPVESPIQRQETTNPREQPSRRYQLARRFHPKNIVAAVLLGHRGDSCLLPVDTPIDPHWNRDEE